ncbi:hypothetical protein [Tessaracoccus sp.]
MRRAVDVPSMVTGLILLGFGAIVAWLLTGGQLVGPASMWFASILLIAGLIGLVISLTRTRR